MSAVDLVLKDVCKSYGGRRVLDRFSHTFPSGRVSAVMGPSGAGKTTLLRLIAGLEAPDSGEILGRPSGGIAMVFQEDRLPPRLTAAACLRAVLPGAADRDARIDAALRALGLGEDLDKPVSAYSGGMRRRVALARALLYPSPLALLDEPFKGLDDDTRRAALALAAPLLAGRTVVLVTHDAADARALGAEILQIPPPPAAVCEAETR